MSDPQFFYLGAWSPFDPPVTPPSTLFTDAPRVSLCFNKSWLPYVLAALKALTRPESWNVDPSTLAAMREDLWGGITAWKDECVSDIMFRQQANCLLQVSFDGGTTWATIFDASTCVHALVPNPTSPQPLGPPPSLTCTDYDLVVPAWNMAELPVVVNAGDTIQIVSHGDDLWTDDEIGYVTGINNAYCIDGTVADPVTGICGVSEPAHTGDPLMSANHMTLLLVVNGTAYNILTGTVTIPSGVANARAFFVCNDGAPANNLGTQHVSVEICTNRWYHTFDFSTGLQQGWTNARAMPWDGSGFAYDGSGPDMNVDSPLMSTGVVTFFEHFYDPPLKQVDSLLVEHCAYIPGSGCILSPETPGAGGDFLEPCGTNTTHYDHVSCYTHTDTAESPRHKLVKVILGGTGTEPIWP